MSTTRYQVGDSVWVLLKMGQLEPGEIAEPPSCSTKANCQFVLCYGTKKYEWIPDEHIVLHDKKKKKLQTCQNASSKNSNVPQTKILGEKKRKIALPSNHSDAESDEFSMPVKKINATKRSKHTASLGLNEADSERFSSPKIEKNESYGGNSSDNIPSYSADFAPDYLECLKPPTLDLKGLDIKSNTKKIGFLGLGNKGQGIVRNLLRSGHSVTVWNKTPDKCQHFLIGAQVASTPHAVVIDSDITFCCMSDTNAALEVVYGHWGVLQALDTCYGQNKGYVEMTSMNPATSKVISEEVVKRRGRYLEASLNGSILQAIDGMIFILGSGDKYLFNECESCFNAIARHAMFVGPNVGSASTYNIAHSMIVGTMCTALAESIALINHYKLDPNQFLDMFKYGVLDSKLIFEKGKAMLNKEYAGNIPVKDVQKKFKMGLELANSCGQPIPVLAATNETFKRIKLMGYTEHDVSSIYEGTRK